MGGGWCVADATVNHLNGFYMGSVISCTFLWIQNTWRVVLRKYEEDWFHEAFSKVFGLICEAP